MCFSVIVASAVAGGSIAAFAGQDENISSLKDEINTLKEEMEKQNRIYIEKIQAMENRLEQLGHSDIGLENTANDAKSIPEEAATADQEARTKVAKSADSENMIPLSRDDMWKQLPYFTKGLKYEGYLRSGFGVNGEGGHQVFFQAPGSMAKYRLGNETDT